MTIWIWKIYLWERSKLWNIDVGLGIA